MKEELNSLLKMKTWTVLEPHEIPPNASIVNARWVNRIKNNGRYKSRLVAKGFTQIKGVNYNETYAPVVRLISLRYLLALATENGWPIHQMDVETAFLHAELKEFIFMRLPEGCGADSGKIVLLNRSIYGLKQAPREFNELLVSKLTKHGFKQLITDPCLFIKEEEGKITCIISAFVDDLLITGQLQKILEAKAMLKSEFEMKDLGEAKTIIGLEINRTETSTTMHQEPFIKAMKNLKWQIAEEQRHHCQKVLIHYHISQHRTNLLKISTSTNKPLVVSIGWPRAQDLTSCSASMPSHERCSNPQKKTGTMFFMYFDTYKELETWASLSRQQPIPKSLDTPIPTMLNQMTEDPLEAIFS